MPTLALTASPLSTLIDVNFILFNRIFVLAATLLCFTAILLLRRSRGEEIPPHITASIKLSLLGFLLLWGELTLTVIPGYQALLDGALTVIALLCLANLVIYLFVDIYLRLHNKAEVPSFLRDAVRLVVYLAAGIISLRLVFRIDVSAIVTTTSVITAVIAFAMQSTLANALSGFSIQTDKLLHRHNWIAIKEKGIFGEIVNVSFRYTTLRCLDSTKLMVPNSFILQNVITLHGSCESEDKPAVQLEVMLGYDLPPERAKGLLLRVLQDEPEILSAPAPLVRLMALNESGITYQLRFWIVDQAHREQMQDVIHTQVWYAVTREGHRFPFPHRQIVTAEARPPFIFSRDHVAADLCQSELFAMLDDAAIASLADQAPVRVFGPGEVVVRQGESGSSLFIVLKGELEVSVDGAAVGSIPEDSFFGEMSLLTGEYRKATVRALNEVWLAEVTKELMEPLLRANPEISETLSTILAERERRNLESAKGKGKGKTARSEDYLSRVRQFFGL
jgi:small-conductance mechanosensitive channel/CRP-like cAMP-binding protein